MEQVKQNTYQGVAQKTCILKSNSLDNLGPKIKEKLFKNGITNPRLLALTPLKQLSERTSMGTITCEKIQKPFLKELSLLRTAKDIWEQRKGMKYLTTGSNNLDELLGGGIEQSNITEFSISIMFCLLFLILPILTIPLLFKEARKAYLELLETYDK